MASSRVTLNQIDPTDVAVAWAAFEEINSVMVTVEIYLTVRGQTREPRLFGQAWSLEEEDGEAKSLVLASASSWVFDHRSLDTALFHLLYSLDGHLAGLEMSNAGKKGA